MREQDKILGNLPPPFAPPWCRLCLWLLRSIHRLLISSQIFQDKRKQYQCNLICTYCVLTLQGINNETKTHCFESVQFDDLILYCGTFFFLFNTTANKETQHNSKLLEMQKNNWQQFTWDRQDRQTDGLIDRQMGDFTAIGFLSKLQLVQTKGCTFNVLIYYL